MLNVIIKTVIYISVKLMNAMECLLSVPYYFKTKKKVPRITNKILLYSARRLLQMISNKEILCEDVIKAYIARINQVNPLLNAVVEDKFDEAIAKAKHFDEIISKSDMDSKELLEKYPLLGLPLTVKESISMKDSSYTSGKVFIGGRRATRDAPIVKLCKDAGAIPLLVSNTPELSANFETFNNVTGLTRNPYDHRRTTGGSSGGEAALLGAGASLIGLGSDIYGSLRLPAHFCGVWGHKSSPYSTSIEGHYPTASDVQEWKKVFTLGPMARYASDLSLILDVITEKRLKLHTSVDLRNVKYYYMDYNHSTLYSRLDKHTHIAIQKLITYIESSNPGSVKKIHLDDFKYTAELPFLKMLSFEVEDLLENDGKDWLKELFGYLTGRSRKVFVLVVLQILKRLYTVFIPNTVQCQYDNVLNKLRCDLTAVLGNDGVLIYPCHPTSARFHGRMYGNCVNYSFLGLFNCLGFPVTNCTLGLNSNGLPVGVQIAAVANNDRLTIAVAEEIEKVFGGWVAP
ncbi:hypothetical protein PPYR_06351 [Photinus pyralis]|uniref:Amidase domain-containing protein n=1 Tax=Photinus pyralis TaxID=7054 RepID=A0A5N4ATE2_PHOPY|nr:fatty-acid amide hydrolase 2-like [Photinus pyralis]XP_031338077.1 fatty-acid amide hydrolase 2-like [Photinus pyralis]XP_031338078.1 fatty-acid amide hydrolase 2-like [Photinus pyralis]XP_031338079.1 fatty-acid amide hydrolase 2-like [Photinus pyralis]XP_031338080.1 fatty-acid amide hydrolase 2-like [Photinus pyralis]KAB0800611.1 hypothetical protein PPYR_06351 [Photinus pyralis]